MDTLFRASGGAFGFPGDFGAWRVFVLDGILALWMIPGVFGGACFAGFGGVCWLVVADLRGAGFVEG